MRPWTRLKVVQDALLTDAAKEFAAMGWSLENIEDHTCVECGEIELPDFSAGGSVVPKPIPGRKLGKAKSGREFDAGHMCGNCMGDRA